jgi:tetratricopeptide (TPR) repeat protein
LATRADHVLEPPPETIRAKDDERRRVVLSSLDGFGPDRTLEATPDQDRLKLIETRARWGRPEGLWTAAWLERLARLSPRALEILAARLEDFPLDPRTNELFASLADPEGVRSWCMELMGLMTARSEPPAPDPAALGDEAFISALCLPEAERAEAMADLLALHPEHPWLNRTAGLALLKGDDLQGALSLLEKALATEPAALTADLTTLARLRHRAGMDLWLIAADLGPLDPNLARLARRSPAALATRPEGAAPDEDLAYALLEAGRASEALAVAPSEGPAADKILILAAAAPGADPELLKRALALPPERLRAASVPWTLLGLLVREGLDHSVAAFEAAGDPSGPSLEAVEAIIEGRGDLLEALYLGRDPWFQGRVCLAAWLALGTGAPADCPERAAGFLFPGERPPMPYDARPRSPGQNRPPEDPGPDSPGPVDDTVDNDYD